MRLTRLLDPPRKARRRGYPPCHQELYTATRHLPAASSQRWPVAALRLEALGSEVGTGSVRTQLMGRYRARLG